jgi:hypothetical protein
VRVSANPHKVKCQAIFRVAFGRRFSRFDDGFSTLRGRLSDGR